MRVGTRWSKAALVAVMFAAASCKDSPAPERASTFTGTFSGAVTGKKTGTSYFETTPTADGTLFTVFGFSSDDVVEFGFDREVSVIDPTGLPPVGTYDVGFDNADFTSVAYFGDIELHAGAGSITITSSADKAVKGSFNVTYATSAGGSATFVGTFNATRCPDC